ncbi:MAG: AlpA family phage regulatory protein [Gammaproteobacteria bacterium]|nr:AlpA family phage regulatory protein [Gammaproteobacteria bacterium]
MKKIIRLPEFMDCYGLSKSTIYKRISDGLLPKPISLGARAVGWPANEVGLISDALAYSGEREH